MSDEIDISEAQSASVKSFVTALVFNAIVFGAELGVFTLIRPYFKAVYEPRTYVPPSSKRVKPLSQNIFLWPLAVFRADYRAIKHANGMDAYFFVRFLRMMVKVFLPIWIVSWAVLIPVTTVHTSVVGKDNLDKLTYGNVATNRQVRYAAHLVLAWFFTFWIFYHIKQEMRHFIITRQQHLIEPNHAKSLQANTVLVTGIPQRYLNQRSLLNVYKDLPGGVKKIWINRNLKDLPEIYDRRLAACNKLESAETALLNTAAKLRLQAIKEEQKKGAKSVADDAKTKQDTDPEASPIDVQTAATIVPADKRPTHRLTFLFGKKVDTIEWAREEIRECNRLLEEGRAEIDGKNAISGEEEVEEELGQSEESESKGFRPATFVKDTTGALKGTTTALKGKVTARLAGYGDEKYPPLNSAFITFNRQIAAHLAVQVLSHHEPYRMSQRYNEVSPSDVIWSNLNLNPYEQKIRVAISYSITAGLIILWSFPVAFIGAISNISSLCQDVSWLSWICDLPDVVVGIISGILPPVLLAVLMMLLPIVLRLLARFEGIPKYTGLELSLMTRYFIFLVVHSFLIVTLSSGIIAAIGPLSNNPTSIPGILANQLPKASTFFLTYIILQGLAGTAGGFLQIVPLIIYYVKLFILGSTPRSVYGIKYVLRNVAWGTLFPGITLLTVIAIGYSVISPVINGLACATFFLFFQLYKYLFLWVYEQSPSSDTGGMFFPKAIQHIFVGLYIEQVCLCALFFLARDGNDKASAIPQGALMVVLIVITAGFHVIINNSYDPLLSALPLSLKDKSYTPVEIGHEPEHIHDVEEGNGSGQSPADTTGRTSTSKARDLEPETAYEDVSQKPLTSSEKEKNKAVDEPVGGGQDATERQKVEENEFGFAHPAISRPQRAIWLPKDSLGLYKEEVRGCEEMGISTSMEGAVMNEKGKVDVPNSEEVAPGVV